MKRRNLGAHYLPTQPAYNRPHPDPRRLPPHRPHLPQRPTWHCKVCNDPWPCKPARLLLLLEHRGNMIALSIFMGSYLHDAVRDLIRLHPDTPLDSGELFDRFLAWTNPRQLPPATRLDPSP